MIYNVASIALRPFETETISVDEANQRLAALRNLGYDVTPGFERLSPDGKIKYLNAVRQMIRRERKS
jgi:hypothetical protein